MKIISRKEAKEQGLKRYFTGKPCRNGHVTERNRASGECLICFNDKQIRFRRQHPIRYAAYSAKYYIKHRKKMLEAARIARAKRHDYYREYNKKYYELRADLIAVLRKEMPELLKEFGL